MISAPTNQAIGAALSFVHVLELCKDPAKMREALEGIAKARKEADERIESILAVQQAAQRDIEAAESLKEEAAALMATARAATDTIAERQAELDRNIAAADAEVISDRRKLEAIELSQKQAFAAERESIDASLRDLNAARAAFEASRLQSIAQLESRSDGIKQAEADVARIKAEAEALKAEYEAKLEKLKSAAAALS